MSDLLAPLFRQAAALAATWGVLLAPAWFVGGYDALVGLTSAAVLCFLPAGLMLLKSAAFREPNPLVDLVLGMGLRMFIVLAGAWLIGAVRPELTGRTFLYWLIPLYAVALVVETQQALSAESVRGSVAQSAHGG